MTDHTARAHSTLSASSSHRWMACPGSIRMSAGLESRTNSFAAEGTAAHQLAETCLSPPGMNADDMIGRTIKVEGFEFEVDLEMVEAVDVYVAYVSDLRAKGYDVELEQRFDLSSLYPGMFGTADCVAYDEKTKHLVVADYKHGRGVAVEPQENSQGLYYALGACHRYHNRGIDKVTVAIVQPRCPHPAGPIREWTTDAVTLLEWSADLIEAAKRTESADAPLVAGDHCKFCPAAATCPALQNVALEAAKADFTNDGSLLVADPAQFDVQHLAEALSRAAIIEAWVKRVRETAHHELEAGRVIPGWKLVAKRPVRKWKDEQRAIDYLRLYGLDDKDIFAEPSFRSPAQIEKVIGKKNAGDIADLVEKVSSGAVVAPADDPRECVRAEAARDFQGA